MKRNIIKALALSALFGILLTIGFNSYWKKVTFPEIIVHLAFGNNLFKYGDIVSICTLTVPYFTYMFLFGMCIYEHYTVASVYFFSRCQNRTSWLLKEIMKLLIYTFIFVATMPLFGMLGAGVANEIIYLENGYIMYIYYVVIYTLWLYSFTLIANILAIRFNGFVGIIVSAGIIFMYIALLSLWSKDNIFSMDPEDNPYVERNGIILMFNMFSHLVLSWHTSDVAELSIYTGKLGVDFDMVISMVLFTIIAMLTTQGAIALVKKQDVFTVSERLL